MSISHEKDKELYQKAVTFSETCNEVLAKLRLLRTNLDNVKGLFEEKYARELNDELRRLSEIGDGVTGFCIAESAMQHQPGFDPLTHQRTYPKEGYVERTLLLTNIDNAIVCIQKFIPENKLKL